MPDTEEVATFGIDGDLDDVPEVGVRGGRDRGAIEEALESVDDVLAVDENDGGSPSDLCEVQQGGSLGALGVLAAPVQQCVVVLAVVLPEEDAVASSGEELVGLVGASAVGGTDKPYLALVVGLSGLDGVVQVRDGSGV